MNNDRKFYKKTFTVTFFSETPEILQHGNIGSLVYEALYGDIVMYSTDENTETITSQEAAWGLVDAGSDPSFFQIEDPTE